jgi:hypothetical protein
MIIKKKSSEEFYLGHEFRRSDGQGWLASEESILSATVASYQKDRPIAATSTMIANTSVISGNATNSRVTFLLKGGTAGKSYIIKINVVTSLGQIFEDWYEVRVQ